MDCSQIKIEHIKSSIRDAYYVSKESNKILFRDIKLKNASNEIVASIYLNKAISIMESCKAIYYSSIEELENSVVEFIFTKFDIYNREVLRNLATYHSHQWSDIEFHEFEEAVSQLIDIAVD